MSENIEDDIVWDVEVTKQIQEISKKVLEEITKDKEPKDSEN